MKGHDTVNEVLRESESRVTNSEVRDEMIFCGRAARKWDNGERNVL